MCRVHRGIPSDAGIIEFTESVARRTGDAHPVRQAVGEIGAQRRTRVYVSHDGTSGVDVLMKRLRDDLAADAGREWEIADTGSVSIGENPEEVRDRLSAQADVRVVLVTTGSLIGPAERARALGSAGPVVAAALGHLPDGELEIAPLPGTSPAPWLTERRRRGCWRCRARRRWTSSGNRWGDGRRAAGGRAGHPGPDRHGLRRAPGAG